jgi:hypothetical protein
MLTVPPPFTGDAFRLICEDSLHSRGTWRVQAVVLPLTR